MEKELERIPLFGSFAYVRTSTRSQAGYLLWRWVPVCEVYRAILAATDTLHGDDGAGGGLAYLMAAILKGTYVELIGADAAWLALLRETFGPDHRVWKFVTVSADMQCRACGFTGDNVREFVTTDTAGERSCPKCNSTECYVIEGRA